MIKLSDLKGIETFSRTVVELWRIGLPSVVLLDIPGNVVEADIATSTVSSDVEFKSRREVLLREALNVVNWIEYWEGRAMPIYEGVFHQTKSNAIKIDLKLILTSLKMSQIPVLVPLATRQSDSSILERNPHTLFQGICKELLNSPYVGNPFKVVVMNEQGGLCDTRGRPIGFVNLAEEYAKLRIAQLSPTTSHLSGNGSLTKDLETVHSILQFLPTTSSAIIASASSSSSLITNVITDKPVVSPSLISRIPTPKPIQLEGKTQDVVEDTTEPTSLPTILRKGLKLQTYTTLDEVSEPRLAKLLEDSFRKPLMSDAYFAKLSTKLDKIIIAGDYEGAIIVTREPAYNEDGTCSNEDTPAYYLDKFAVDPKTQGIGVSDILWRRLTQEYPNLFWRSRKDNPVNKWYFERSDGSFVCTDGNGKEWFCFFYGSAGLQGIESYRSVCESLEESFASLK